MQRMMQVGEFSRAKEKGGPVPMMISVEELSSVVPLSLVHRSGHTPFTLPHPELVEWLDDNAPGWTYEWRLRECHGYSGEDLVFITDKRVGIVTFQQPKHLLHFTLRWL